MPRPSCGASGRSCECWEGPGGRAARWGPSWDQGWRKKAGRGRSPRPLLRAFPLARRKAELLLDSQAEVQGLEAEIRRLRQEVRSDVPRHGRAFLNPFPAPSPVLPASSNPVPSRPNPSGWQVASPYHTRLAQAQALTGQAKRAELYREEAERCRNRRAACPACRRNCDAAERLQAAEACKAS